MSCLKSGKLSGLTSVLIPLGQMEGTLSSVLRLTWRIRQGKASHSSAWTGRWRPERLKRQSTDASKLFTAPVSLPRESTALAPSGRSHTGISGNFYLK
ncbi:hypothetical protein BCR44DRAFT_196660 [Catenaria anguillulae PL171]|uniref:Uncharacterized protein n=1 Tax=Catenaria anguillulae PL171 TaxID=765915 RepID=A0A1Y2HML5_9FUNG|nr:hypothetical protein BCR44DRAFT_196660 [Catenaria anguillulae PL171]